MSLLLSIPLFALLISLGLAASMLPRSLELWLGRRFGRLCHKLGLFKKRIAAENISRALPELGTEARRCLLAANYEHYGILFFEFLHFFSPLPGHFRRYARRVSVLENRDIWKKAVARGKGVIFFSAHLGFWEMSAAAAGIGGINPTIVTTVLKPKWLHDRITACRASTGVNAAFHPGSLPAIMRTLSRGGSVAFMNDQYAPPPMGLPAVFFGMKVDTLSIVGPLADRTGAAILPVYSVRDKNGLTHVSIEPEVELKWSAARNPAEATQIIASHVEARVRRDPDQWLWLHRRFKNIKPA